MSHLTPEILSIFAVNGWSVQSQSPLRVVHDETGDLATGQAADMVGLQLLAEVRAEGSCVPDTATTVESFAELVQLSATVGRYAGVARQQEGTAGEMAAWRSAYDLVFSRNIVERVNVLLARLDQSFDYCDPDSGTCRDDVCSYEAALSAHVERMLPFFAAAGAPADSLPA
jgi:hypothetical protein